jgi:cysteine-rich repeat protein
MYKKFPTKVMSNCDNLWDYSRFCPIDVISIDCPIRWFNMENNKNDDRERCADFLRKRESDQENGLNLRIPSEPSVLEREFYVNISTSSSSSNDFIANTATTVLWTQFTLDEKTVNFTKCSYSGNNPAYRCDTLFSLPDLFNKKLAVQRSTLMIGQTSDLTGDVVFSDQLQKQTSNGRLSTSTDTRGQQVYGFVTTGCVPIYLKFKIKWEKIRTDVEGLSVEATTISKRRRRLLSDIDEIDELMSSKEAISPAFNNNKTILIKNHNSRQRHLLAVSPNSYQCWKRTIILVSVLDAGKESMNCKAPPTLNHLRYMLYTQKTQNREYFIKQIMDKLWAESVDPTLSFNILFSKSYAEVLLECASPTTQGTSVGGIWKDYSDTEPGHCVQCSAAKIKQSSNFKTKRCDMTDPDERTMDCCYECKRGFMQVVSREETKICISSCKPGQRYNDDVGKCKACEDGKYSNGGLEDCMFCHQLGYSNSRVDRLRGCISCGLRFSSGKGTECTPCVGGTFVPPGEIGCQSCPLQGAYYLPDILSATACVACGVGTYGDFSPVGVKTCVQCPRDTYNTMNASTTCISCPNGKRSVSNRTICVACPSIVHQHTEYFEPGCSIRCKPLESYEKINPYVRDGCAACDSVLLPNGTYPDPDDCSRPITCKNAPANAYYTGVGRYSSIANFKGDCGWGCIAGYSKSSSSCTSCPILSFKEEKHQYILSPECQFTCKPYIYIDGTKACTTRCIDLLSVTSIKLRVRDYSTTTSRPSYVLNTCGSTESIPRSEIPFLRLGRWAYLDSANSYEASRCGNSLLNIGEECDDGNTISGDGCSSLCKIETNKYWDCDLIGTPCLPNCGWKVINTDDWGLSLQGFVLPRCSTTGCVCTGNISYFDVSNMLVGTRGNWMNSHFSKCDCGGNIMRTVPYEECDVDNLGCRLCESHQYHDDLLAMCVNCGSRCINEFTSETSSSFTSCSQTVSTSQLTLGKYDNEMIQEYIGCKKCISPIFKVRFIPDTPGSYTCRFVCYRDTTGETTEYDTYCSVKVDNITGTCPSKTCTSCSTKLNTMMTSYKYTGIDNDIVYDSDYFGKYLEGCTDEQGYEWVNCDEDSKPSGSIFTGAATIAGANRGCPWKCADNHLEFRGKCIPCFLRSSRNNSSSCISGEEIDTCPGSDGLVVCKPCDGALPFALQVWVSGPSYEYCTPECEEGFSWSIAAQSICTACSIVDCALGEKYIPCSIRSDAMCVSCDSIYTSIGYVNTEFIKAGFCDTRCASGYYADLSTMSTTCSPCVTSQNCDLGYKQSSMCLEPSQRFEKPTCVPCSVTPIKTLERWGSSCEILCILGAVRLPENNTCVLCILSLCGIGFEGSCSNDGYATGGITVTNLICFPCPIINIYSVLTTAGNCNNIRCVDGYSLNARNICQRNVVVIPMTTSNNNNENNNTGSSSMFYPTRSIRHSGMNK